MDVIAKSNLTSCSKSRLIRFNQARGTRAAWRCDFHGSKRSVAIKIWILSTHSLTRASWQKVEGASAPRQRRELQQNRGTKAAPTFLLRGLLRRWGGRGRRARLGFLDFSL